MTDEEIITLYWQRDELAIRETDNSYGRMLKSLALRIVHDLMESEECLQDTYLKAWDTIPPQRPQYFSAWLAKIIRRLALNVLRMKTAVKREGDYQAAGLDELAAILSGGTDPEEETNAVLLGECISKYLDTLSKDSRVLFIRRYFFEDSVKEAAAYAGMRENNARVRLHRIRQGLRSYLLENGYDV
ncbi:MAG: sigma-70 family RNA polymerase sigma factor [Solobacterium sp.]|nr:sigma-70 family RNA polymerase sigma factor [Solobacterium sp.]